MAPSDCRTLQILTPKSFSSFRQFASVLGRGSYKTVYYAFDSDEALEVAWNKLHVERLQPHELEKVSNEVKLLERVQHNNIIRFYCTLPSFEKNGVKTLDFITEQMTSGTLKDYLKKAKAIKLKVIRRWCSNILEAIAYLHAQKPPIMHRDLKCDNIFINGHVGEVKIGDLGLSAVKMRDKADSVIGTPEFMAPETFESSYTEKVDIYAFGMCLLEMVTMEYPYSECENFAQIFQKVYVGKKPKVFDRIKAGAIKKVIAACLQREEHRPSAEQLLQDPLFRDWDHDDGRANNLSLLIGTDESTGTEENNQRGNNVAVSGNVIEWSDPLDRTLMISVADGASNLREKEVDVSSNEKSAEVSVVTAQANETGGFKVSLTIPIGNQIKRVEFEFHPFKDTASVLAQELVDEFRLDASQLVVIENEIELQIREAREKRIATSRNATPQPAPRNVTPVSETVQDDNINVPHSQPFQVENVNSELREPPMSSEQTAETVQAAEMHDNYNPSSNVPQSLPEPLSETRTEQIMEQAETYENVQVDTNPAVHAGFYESQSLESAQSQVQPPSAIPTTPSGQAAAVGQESLVSVMGHAGNQGGDIPQASVTREFNPGMLSNGNVPVSLPHQEIPLQQSAPVQPLAQQGMPIPLTPSGSPPSRQDILVLPAHGQHEAISVPPAHSQSTQLDTPASSAPIMHPNTVSAPQNVNQNAPTSAPNVMAHTHQALPQTSAQLMAHAPHSSPQLISHQTPTVQTSNMEASPDIQNYHQVPIGQVSAAMQGSPQLPERFNENTVSNAQPPLPPSSSAPQAKFMSTDAEISPVQYSRDAVMESSAYSQTARQSAQPVPYVDTPSDVSYSTDASVAHVAPDTQQSAGPIVYSSQAQMSSTPVSVVNEASVAASSISHSSSEQVLRTNQKSNTELISPHRSISAPAGSISVAKSSNYLSVQSDVSAALSVAEAGNIQGANPMESAEPNSKGSNPVLDQAPNIHHVAAPHVSTPSESRPPSLNIVVVGGDRRNSASDHSRSRHRTPANLSAQSLPEYGRNEAKPVPRSSSMMANVSDASQNAAPYQNVRDRDASLLPSNSSLLSVPPTHSSGAHHGAHAPYRGNFSDSPLVTMGRRSSSWRSSQSENSMHDMAIRSSPSDTNLRSTYDQKWLSACLELMEYSAKGRYSSVLQKLDQGAPAQFADYDRRTPLHLASARGHADVCTLLIERGASTQAVDRWGRTPLVEATANGHELITKLLRANGAEEYMDMLSDIASLQMLQNAAKGDLDAVRSMIYAGANAKYKDYDERTALHLACTEGHAEVASLLLVNDADWNAKDSLNRTPVDDAVRNGNLHVLRVLRQFGADIPPKLLGAQSDSHYQLGSDLVENAAKGRINAVKKCLRHGANPNFQDYDKRTPLHLAAVEGHVHVVEYLLENGANPSMTDRWSVTPREEAVKANMTAVVDEIDNWEKRRVRKSQMSSINADPRPASNGHIVRNLEVHTGNLEDLRVAVGQNATRKSIPMYMLADGFDDRNATSTPNPEVMATMDAALNSTPHGALSANFKDQESTNPGDIEQQVRILEIKMQHQLEEEVRRLRQGHRNRPLGEHSEEVFRHIPPQAYTSAVHPMETLVGKSVELVGVSIDGVRSPMMRDGGYLEAAIEKIGKQTMRVHDREMDEGGQAQQVASELMETIISAVCTTKDQM